MTTKKYKFTVIIQKKYINYINNLMCNNKNYSWKKISNKHF